MFDLFVDTSRKGISMALLESGANRYIESIDESARGETASAMLDALLEKAHATLDQVTRVMVTLGPGSFSGLRTGVAFCEGLSFSGKRKLYGVSTLAALACFADAPENADAVVGEVIKSEVKKRKVAAPLMPWLLSVVTFGLI